MVAESRAASVVEVADLLAGMYIHDWDRLSKYWEESEAIETFLERFCRISPQRWQYWMHGYGEMKQTKKRWGLFGGRSSREHGRNDSSEKKFQHSAELVAVLKAAEQIAPAHDESQGQKIPILTMETVLYAMAQNTDSELGRSLRATGLDVDRLERDARFPRHAPLH